MIAITALVHVVVQIYAAEPWVTGIACLAVAMNSWQVSRRSSALILCSNLELYRQFMSRYEIIRLALRQKG